MSPLFLRSLLDARLRATRKKIGDAVFLLLIHALFFLFPKVALAYNLRINRDDVALSFASGIGPIFIENVEIGPGPSTGINVSSAKPASMEPEALAFAVCGLSGIDEQRFTQALDALKGDHAMTWPSSPKAHRFPLNNTAPIVADFLARNGIDTSQGPTPS